MLLKDGCNKKRDSKLSIKIPKAVNVINKPKFAVISAMSSGELHIYDKKSAEHLHALACH
jgi:hypothetical protein